jgi:uncharacterized hydrophobic protein (TIGR00271 family)
VIGLEVFGESSAMESVAGLLEGFEGVRGVRVVDARRPGHSVIVASVRPKAVDGLVEELRRQGVRDEDVQLTRLDVVGSLATGPTETGIVWSDVIGTAWLNARPMARYLAFMVVAGVIGCYGVLDNNVILIVGAMAVAPDLLPITAIAVGLVGRQKGLASRALMTLALGLAVVVAAAAGLTFILDHLDLVPNGFSIEGAGALEGLTTVSNETITVALAAGVAGMLALETRASSAVGVAISVTTIPVSAYLGVAAGLGELDEAAGSLGVLGANVTMMVLGAVGTLTLQGVLVRRAIARRRRATPG